MKNNEISKILSENDFHIDSLGRIVIDNTAILSAVSGAISSGSGLDDFLVNGACANAGCS